MVASAGGFSIVFNRGIVVTATAICHLQPGISNQTAQALLAQLLGRNLELVWSSDGQLGLLPEPIFALFGDRKIYLRYKISENSTSGGTISSW